MQIVPFAHQFKTFVYQKVVVSQTEDKLTFTYHFQVTGNDEHSTPHVFTPSMSIAGVSEDQLQSLGKARIEHYAFLLGLCEIPSYWKAVLTPHIEIACGSLSTVELAFWKKLLVDGLGEFFYVNQIPPMSPEWIVTTTDRTAVQRVQPLLDSKRVLVPVGGGKDSIVTLELLAAAGFDIFTTSGNKGASSQVVYQFSKEHPLHGNSIFTRTLDPFLFELNAAGYPNGHTPFSSILAFLTTLIADLQSIPYVALSNERSANEPTGVWHGQAVNHQYSKSLQFEQDVQEYLRTSFNAVPTYFSFLRPWYELQIMKAFIAYPQYFSVFKSCNVGQQLNQWCGNCAKCTFVALLLSAFLPEEQVRAIFGKDMLSDTTLIPYVEELIGQTEYKPFECIGTIEESQVALWMTISRYQGKTLPALLQPFAGFVTEHAARLEEVSTTLLTQRSEEHCIPAAFSTALPEHP